MPLKKYAAPLRLELRSSSRLALALAASLSGALLLPQLIPMAFPFRVLLVVAALAVAYEAYVSHFGSRRIVRAVWDEMDEWRLYLADGTELEVQLEGDSFITPEVMVLNFRTARRRFHLVVLQDSLHEEIRRQLRVRLRMEARRRMAADAKKGQQSDGFPHGEEETGT